MGAMAMALARLSHPISFPHEIVTVSLLTKTSETVHIYMSIIVQSPLLDLLQNSIIWKSGSLYNIL